MKFAQSIEVGGVKIGGGEAPVVIAGLCVIESEALLMQTAIALKEACERAGLRLILKASFDKANRSALDSFRGPGIREGLEILERAKRELDVPVTTDVHAPDQVERVAEVADLLQVPAFLCRQTDLLVACARSGRPVNVKKGQFMAPWDMGHVVEKLHLSGGKEVMLTERGTSFGYNRLVVDMAGLEDMRALGAPVCFDATHSTQLPGAAKTGTGGNREAAPRLARAAIAAGVDALFFETHPNPAEALSDGATALPLQSISALLEQVSSIDAALRER